MTLIQFLLGKLAEECGEVGQIAIKAQHFGPDEVYSIQDLTNAERTHHELDDIVAIVEMLNEIGFGYTSDPERIEAKKQKVIHYLEYSVGLGMVEAKALDQYRN